EEQARAKADQIFVSIVGGGALTFGELRDQVAQFASMLASFGVVAGDHIAIMLPNGLDFIRAWAGVGRLGAVAVVINTELTGTFLQHPLADSMPKILIVHSDYLERIDDLGDGVSAIGQIIVAGTAPTVETARLHLFEGWKRMALYSGPMPAAHDLACIMYTSGTTGAPKGVLMPHGHCYLFGLGAVDNLGVNPEDRYYICLPLFHANGLLMQLSAAMIAGARAIIRDRFSASIWLDDVRASRATITHCLGVISAFVIAQPPRIDDRDHALRLILSAPNHPDHELAWRERFGIADVVSGFGMTEVNIPLYGDRTQPRPGSCGRAYSRYFEVEIRDSATDIPVDRGEVGEIMVRPRVASGFMAGYHGLPERTVEAWRNFWFHTGDSGRMDAEGYVYFIDRIKDCIRRRGENVSATDIEAAFLDLPGVAEIAAYAVPSEIDGGEDEIMLALVPSQDAHIEP
ncbi:MAG: long-chain fatty acid--CoA ligase, partial [Rhizobiaceae bacterium]